MAESTVTTIDLLRHGHCLGGEILRGTTDSPLSPRGWEQMQTALRQVEGWQQVVTSPLRRCREFARDFAGRRSLPMSESGEFRELDFGEWDGRELAALWRDNPETLDRYYREPGTVTPPNGESLAQASLRLRRGWDRLLDDFGGQQVLVITHGGSIRLLLTLLQRMPLAACQHFYVPPACLTRLRVHHTPEGYFCQTVFHNPARIP